MPVVFIHGLWLHATSWQPWISLFEEAGYQPIAPGWPGVADSVEAARERPSSIADHGIEAATRHYAQIIEKLPRRPILIGHSFGGMIAEKLLGEDYGAAAVAIDAAQIKGVRPVPLSALRAAFPVFRKPVNRRRAVSLTASQFRYGFGNAISAAESDSLYALWTIPAPARPVFETAVANLKPHSPTAVATANSRRGPLLLVTGGRDHAVPEKVTKSTAELYRHSEAVTDVIAFADRGHSLTVDSGWKEIAEACLAWLSDRGLNA